MCGIRFLNSSGLATFGVYYWGTYPMFSEVRTPNTEYIFCSRFCRYYVVQPCVGSSYAQNTPHALAILHELRNYYEKKMELSGPALVQVCNHIQSLASYTVAVKYVALSSKMVISDLVKLLVPEFIPAFDKQRAMGYNDRTAINPMLRLPGQEVPPVPRRLPEPRSYISAQERRRRAVLEVTPDPLVGVDLETRYGTYMRRLVRT